MFDLGFSELLIIAIIALVVLGPERLPKATRFAGLWVRRARNQWASVKDELERDLASEDLKRTMKEAREAMRDTEQSVRASADEAREEFEQMRTAVASDTRPEDRAAAEAPMEEPREAAGTSLASLTGSHDDDFIDGADAGQVPESDAHQDPVADTRSGAAPGAAPAPAPDADPDPVPDPEDDRRYS